MVDETVPQSLSDAELLRQYEDRLTIAENYQKSAGRLEQEIYRRLEVNGGSAIPSELYVCELITRPSYDQTAFTPLKEIFNDVDLATCFEAEHTETNPVLFPDKWDTRKVIALATRYGTIAQLIVERARSYGRGRLKFERRP